MESTIRDTTADRRPPTPVATHRLRYGLLALAGVLLAVAGLSTPAPGAASPASTSIVFDERFNGGSLGASVFVATLVTASPTPSEPAGWTIELGNDKASAPAVAQVTDQRLTSLNPVLIPANATSAVLSFWQGYWLGPIVAGAGDDGGVLELSTNGGASWADALSIVGFETGGYTGTINPLSGNPLGGRMGWVGETSAYLQVRANLLPLRGQRVLFRLRLGTDRDDEGAATWAVDTVQVTVTAPCGLGAWSAASAYPTPLAHPAVVAQGGLLYSFGGTSPAQLRTGLVYRYNPAAPGWAHLASLPAARSGASAVSDGTFIYILGGEDSNGQPADTLWRYDPNTDTYEARAPFGVPTMYQAAAYLAGKIYRVGGISAGGQPTSSVEVYTIATNTWASAAFYPLPVDSLALAPIGSYLYAAGGSIASGENTAQTYRYDPAANTWDDAAVPDLPVRRTAMASGVLNDHWILAGGESNVREMTSTVGLNLAANAWEALPPLLLGNASAGGAVVGTALYVVGGSMPNNNLTVAVERYAETACATPTLSPSPTPAPLAFGDVHPTDYFYTPVQYLAGRGVISGYADGTFRPYANTTRAQMVKIVVLGFNKPIVIPDPPYYSFADVPTTQPFFAVIETAAALHIVSGYACGGPGEPCDSQNHPYFRPYANVTRGQLSKIDVVAAGWTLLTPASPTFTDVAPASAFYSFVETAVCHGVISGYGDGTFRPGANATRGQISKIVYLSVTGAGSCAPRPAQPGHPRK